MSSSRKIRGSISQGGDESRDSFSSGSFCSDDEIEGKVSFDSHKNLRTNKITQSKEEITKSNNDDTEYTSNMSMLLRDARFFLMKSNNEENIELSKAKSVWSTPPANESRINLAFRTTRNVILIYSVKESGKFCGFARLGSESERDGKNVNWILPAGLTQRALGGVFQLDWISTDDVPFTKTQHLFNSWNDGKPIKIGRDGQEIEPRVGADLCKLFPSNRNVDWSSINHKCSESNKKISSNRIYSPLRNPITPPVYTRSGFRNREKGDRANILPIRRHIRSSYNQLRVNPSLASTVKRRLPDEYSGYYTKRSRDSNREYERKYEDERMESSTRYQSSRRDYGKLRDSRYERPPPPPMPYPPPPPFDSLPPPRYYDVPPLPNFNLSSNTGSNSYRQNINNKGSREDYARLQQFSIRTKEEFSNRPDRRRIQTGSKSRSHHQSTHRFLRRD